MWHKLRMLLAAIAAVGMALWLLPVTAFADGAAPPVVTDANRVGTVVIAAPWVTLIVSFLIPVLNGILTKATWSGAVKGALTIILNAVWALFAAGKLADGAAAFSSTALFTAVMGCLISLASYYQIFKPMNVTSNPGGKLAGVGVQDK